VSAERSTQEESQDELVKPRSGRGRRMIRPARTELNLPAMIDVIFLLLIYFIVTASFAADEGVLTTELPAGGEAADPLAIPPEELRIQLRSVDPAGVEIRVLDQPVESFRGLAEQLTALQAGADGDGGAFSPEDPVVIEPTGQVRWQHVINAFNAAVKAEYTNINFASAGEAEAGG